MQKHEAAFLRKSEETTCFQHASLIAQGLSVTGAVVLEESGPCAKCAVCV